MSESFEKLRHLRGKMNALEKAQTKLRAEYTAQQAELQAEMKSVLLERYGSEYTARLTFYEHFDNKTLPQYDVKVELIS